MTCKLVSLFYLGVKVLLSTGYWWEKLMERYRLVDLGVDGRIILKRAFRYRNGVWIGLVWLRMVTGGGVLCMP
jgi:hypothetical protein